MTLDEAIKHAEEVAEENQRVVDTHIVFDDVTIDMLYCDDTEVIEEHLANCQGCAEEHRQLAEWLKDYKRLLEQELKTGQWEWVQYDNNPNVGNWHCSECDRIVSGAITACNPVYAYKFCPNCGAKMKRSDKR